MAKKFFSPKKKENYFLIGAIVALAALLIVLVFLNRKPEKFYAGVVKNSVPAKTSSRTRIRCDGMDREKHGLQGGDCVDNVEMEMRKLDSTALLNASVYKEPAAECAKRCKANPNCRGSTLNVMQNSNTKGGFDYTCQFETNNQVDFSKVDKANVNQISWARSTPAVKYIGPLKSVGVINMNDPTDVGP